MEIDYNLPLELNCIFAVDVQEQNGIYKKVTRYKAYIEWDNIIGIEEFTKHFMFPVDETASKTVIVTKWGNHIICDHVTEVADMWARYKQWKSKQVIKPLFGIN